MKRKYKDMAILLAVAISAVYLAFTVKGIVNSEEQVAAESLYETTESSFSMSVLYAAQSSSSIEEENECEEEETETKEPAYTISDEEFELLTRLVTAEAENQSFKAQYYVACVVMNRVESEYFPDSITEVVWQKEPSRQFSSMWNGRYDSCETTESCYEAVKYLLENGNELPDDVLYFTSCGYLLNTKPYAKVMDMYYSSQKE